MFTLNEHIEYLMMHHDCVVIPGWGAFVAQYSESFYDHDRHELKKPLRKVGFNASVNHNDGLLAQSLVRREGLSYDDAVRFIAESVLSFRQQLAGGGELGMGRLGFFHSDDQGHVEFIPFHHEMCNDQYFGLRSIRFTPLAELLQAEAASATTQQSAPVPARWWSHRVWQTAASIAVFIGLTLLLTTPIIVNRDHHDMASLTITQMTKPQQQTVGTVEAPAAGTAAIAAEQAPESPISRSDALLLDEGGNCYLVVATLSSTQQAEEYLAMHPDIAHHTVVQHSGKHYRVCVARAATASRLYGFMGQLPKAYRQSWVYEQK